MHPEIDVTRVVPPQELLIPASDQAEMDQREQAIARLNGRAHPTSPVALTASVLTIRTRSRTLFCEKIAMRNGKTVRNFFLDCGAARFPYTILSSSFGMPSREREIESILSTLE